jgi:ADP-ribose pyrophosphatase YjhB (NUDIX family)
MSADASSRSRSVLPTEQYVAGLVRKRMAAGVLFRDQEDRVLLVEPSYKPNWELPGGAVEVDESPWEAASRELAEELGWTRALGRLLVVDHVSPQDARPEGVLFVFDGGVLDAADLAGFTLDEAEILSASLHSLDQARPRVKPLLADRLASAVAAANSGRTSLCKDGVAVI